MENAMQRAKDYEESQLGLFDYSNYSEEFKLKSYERKARIKSKEEVVTNAFNDIAQEIKEQHNDLLQQNKIIKGMRPYEQWLNWCKIELGYKATMSEELLRIGKELPRHGGVNNLPNSYRGLKALASALSKADDETKEEILTAVESKTEEKGNTKSR